MTHTYGLLFCIPSFIVIISNSHFQVANDVFKGTRKTEIHESLCKKHHNAHFKH